LNAIRNLWSRWKATQSSWSQSGEDLIAGAYFANHRLPLPYYLDIGAHHPYQFSNSYRFYRQGGSGVLVEPSLAAWRAITSARPRDKVLRAAVVPRAAKGATVQLQKMSASTLNTVSLEAAKSMARHGRYGRQEVTGVEEVPALTLAALLETHCQRCPDLVSLDIEGLDLPVLRTWDFKRWRPRMFILEIVRYHANGKKMERVSGIDRLMKASGYHLYADTYVNAIFTDRDPHLSYTKV
jgi:FkbM family methyltransferase